MNDLARCPWSGTDPLYIAYHDSEWGVPVHDDRIHFEFLILEGAQAGLSWSTILNKREGYRRAFAGFDPEKVARFTERTVAKLLEDPGILRNRLKVQAAVSNARAFLQVAEDHGSFDAFLRDFVGGAPSCIASGGPRRSRRGRRSRTPWRRSSRAAASSSPARPSCTPTCRPAAW